MIAGDVAGVAVLHHAGRVREHVPDAFAAPVLIDRTFDLIARSRCAPGEVRREMSLGPVALGFLFGICLVSFLRHSRTGMQRARHT
jgi:hypothetical protein